MSSWVYLHAIAVAFNEEMAYPVTTPRRLIRQLLSLASGGERNTGAAKVAGKASSRASPRKVLQALSTRSVQKFPPSILRAVCRIL